MKVFKTFFNENLPPTSHLLTKINGIRLTPRGNHPSTLVVSREEVLQMASILKKNPPKQFERGLQKKFINLFIRHQSTDLEKLEKARAKIQETTKKIEDYKNLKIPTDFLVSKLHFLEAEAMEIASKLKQWEDYYSLFTLKLEKGREEYGN